MRIVSLPKEARISLDALSVVGIQMVLEHWVQLRTTPLEQISLLSLDKVHSEI
jgi:hypothetical protein